MARHFWCSGCQRRRGEKKEDWKNWTAKSVSRNHDPLKIIPDLIVSSFITELFTLHQQQRTRAYRLFLAVKVSLLSTPVTVTGVWSGSHIPNVLSMSVCTSNVCFITLWWCYWSLLLWLLSKWKKNSSPDSCCLYFWIPFPGWNYDLSEHII